MVRSGRPRAFNTEGTLARARDLFWTRGYAATSVQDLVDGLAVQRGSLYGAFGDKRSLYLQAVALYSRENRVHLQEALATDPVLPAMRRVLSDPAALTGTDSTEGQRRGCLIGNTTAELVPGDEDAAAMVAAAFDGFVEVVGAALLRAQASGEVRDDIDPQVQAQLLLLVFQGSALVSRAKPDDARLEAALDVVLASLRRQ